MRFKPIDFTPEDGVNNTVYALTEEWKADEALWTERKSGTNWDNPGGSSEEFDMWYDPGGGDWDTSSAVIEQQDGDWETYDVKDIVTSMVNGSIENYGFILRPGSEMGEFTEGMNYHSSEASESSDRPKLILEVEGTAISDNPFKQNSGMQMSVLSQSIQLEFTKMDSYKIAIHTAQGRVVYSGVFAGKEARIGTNGISSGVYFLSVKSSVGSISNRILIK